MNETPAIEEDTDEIVKAVILDNELIMKSLDSTNGFCSVIVFMKLVLWSAETRLESLK